MTRYLIYLETGDDGRSMAHVPALPGCIARAASRDEVLRRTPDAIREASAWLRRHGEPAPAAEDPVEIEIAGESSGAGPFDPGNTAALLPPDRAPLTPDEMERAFRLLAHSRADMLALVRGLPDDVLDWQPDSESFTIRRVLRHVGNAEEWYVSRLVAPESLPPEWEHDENLPIFEFLEMERRTAIGRLRHLTDEERTAVSHPTAWTDHPEEPWTARKALRRFLEHEREHTGQVKEILVAWQRAYGTRIQTGPKAALLAALAAARADLLAAALAPPEARASRPVCGHWTLKDVLGHVADWEWIGVEGLRQMAAGRPPQVEHVADLDAWNQAHYEARREQPWEDIWADLHAARTALLETLERISQADLARSFALPWGPEGTAYQWVSVYISHDREHVRDLRGG
jgi:uncharacterized damage-inducible protein DinB/predicted RNase H-like HicB family nuclease